MKREREKERERERGEKCWQRGRTFEAEKINDQSQQKVKQAQTEYWWWWW